MKYFLALFVMLSLGRVAVDCNTEDPMKVCVMVEPSPFTYVSGYANRFKALCKQLKAMHNDSIDVITVEAVHRNPPKIWNDIPIHYTRGFRLPHYPTMSLSFDWTFKALRVVRKIRPHILHVSTPGLMIFHAIIISRLFNVPLIASYHTHLPIYVHSYLPWPLNCVAEFLLWILIRNTHALVDLTVVTSPQIKTDFDKHRVPRTRIWTKGVDCEVFHPRYNNVNMRKRMMPDGNLQEDFLILYVGRLGAEKRLKDLKGILERLPDTHLCFVGTGPQEKELWDYFSGTKTVFLGELHDEELSQAFASADVFCMPSDSETLGFVVIESMASGVPVVAARAGGIPSIIDDGETGYLVPVGDTEEYVRRLTRLHDMKVRSEMGRKAREATLEWSWTSSVGKLRNNDYREAQKNFHKRIEQRIFQLLRLKRSGNPCEK